ncbi:MAG: lysoplasmalogenase [Actinobacteria bacterium]|nr:lysoplasmalogenase [Actinomycetota bacterium]
MYALLAAADTLLAATGRDQLRRLTKPLLMPTLLRRKPRPVQRALVLGGLGDIALLGSGSAAFQAGLGSFLAGHVAWVAALRPHTAGAVTSARALPYLAAWAGLNAYLWPRTGKDRIPVLVYSTALLATALAAADTGRADVAAGGALFLMSDALLALERFGDLHLPVHEGLVMGTYTRGACGPGGGLAGALRGDAVHRDSDGRAGCDRPVAAQQGSGVRGHDARDRRGLQPGRQRAAGVRRRRSRSRDWSNLDDRQQPGRASPGAG